MVILEPGLVLQSVPKGHSAYSKIKPSVIGAYMLTPCNREQTALCHTCCNRSLNHFRFLLVQLPDATTMG